MTSGGQFWMNQAEPHDPRDDVHEVRRSVDAGDDRPANLAGYRQPRREPPDEDPSGHEEQERSDEDDHRVALRTSKTVQSPTVTRTG